MVPGLLGCWPLCFWVAKSIWRWGAYVCMSHLTLDDLEAHF